MFCGSCLRDNILARALLDAGHDVLLIPTYTPTRTDETNVSMNKVFLGGVNVYLQQNYNLFRKTPQFLDRLFDFKPFLKLVTRLGISVDPANLGEMTVSMLRGTKGFLRKEILRLVRFLTAEFYPEIINIPNSLLIALAPAFKTDMKSRIVCTLQGEDLFLQGLPDPYRRESLQLIREHAASVDAFIAVSHFGAQSMSEYLGIDRNRIHVVPMGLDFKDFDSIRRNDPEKFTIGYLARIAPEKGLHFLCEAYRVLRSSNECPPSFLHAAGYLSPENKSYLARIQNNLHTWGLADQFRYHGELDRRAKLKFLENLSVFSVPGPYAEPKGLFLLEALACGIPVIQPRRGAFTEILDNTGGGILVEPDNPEALAQGLLELWKDPAGRMELGMRGYKGVRNYYSSKRMADTAVAVYQTTISGNG